MTYQFEYEEITNCGECPCHSIIDHACTPDWCSLQDCAVTPDDTLQENDCPLVAVSKTETVEPCEWCKDGTNKSFEVIWENDGFNMISDIADFCPNCGRKLD